MKIAIANDHAGTEYKKILSAHLIKRGFSVINLGTDENLSVNYPDYAEKVAKSVTSGEANCGILICGTGIGMSIAANKFKGIRAAVCGDCYSAEMTKRHNDCNVLCLGARVIGSDLMLKIVDAYLDAEYEGGKHAVRLQKIAEFENNN